MQNQFQQKQGTQTQKEFEERQQRLTDADVARDKRKKTLLWGCGALLVVALSVTAVIVFKPGPFDDFAKCLTEKGAVMYGEDWCQYTKAQKGMFGKSFKYVNYEVKHDLKIRPTWVINGETYETVQSFERLAALTGCTLGGKS